MHQEPIGPDALATASAAETLRAAKRLVSVGKPDAAAVVLSALLKRFPGNRKARGLLAEIEATPPALPLAKTPEERIVIERLHAATASQRHGDMLKLAQALLPAHPDCALLQNILGVAHAALGDHGSAVAFYQRALQLRTDYAEAAFNLGVSHQEKGEAREALAAYRRALKHGPKRAAAFNNTGTLLQTESDLDGAIAAFNQAITLEPDTARFYQNRGLARASAGHFQAAVADFEIALALAPEQTAVYLHAAASLQSLGQLQEAQTCLWQALRIAQKDPMVIEALSRVIKPSDAKNLERTAQAALAAAAPESEGAMRCHYGLAEIELMRERDEQALYHLGEAGRIGKELSGFTFDEEERIFRAATTVVTTGPGPSAPSDPEAPVPIFILGMPGSGTCLVEASLGVHDDVYTLGPFEALRRAIMATNGLEQSVTAGILGDLRQRYLAEVHRRIGTRPRYFTDAMPTNYRFVGFIAAAFPEAKILYTHRRPEAVGWLNYRMHFPARGMAFAYDQRDVARMICLQMRYMAIWESRFSERLVRLDYDVLMTAPEVETRSLYAALGLAWTPDVVDVFATDRTTYPGVPSACGNGFTLEGCEDWRRFAPWLKPMLDELALARPVKPPGYGPVWP